MFYTWMWWPHQTDIWANLVIERDSWGNRSHRSFQTRTVWTICSDCKYISEWIVFDTFFWPSRSNSMRFLGVWSKWAHHCPGRTYFIRWCTSTFQFIYFEHGVPFIVSDNVQYQSMDAFFDRYNEFCWYCIRLSDSWLYGWQVSYSKLTQLNAFSII